MLHTHNHKIYTWNPLFLSKERCFEWCWTSTVSIFSFQHHGQLLLFGGEALRLYVLWFADPYAPYRGEHKNSLTSTPNKHCEHLTCFFLVQLAVVIQLNFDLVAWSCCFQMKLYYVTFPTWCVFLRSIWINLNESLSLSLISFSSLTH